MLQLWLLMSAGKCSGCLLENIQNHPDFCPRAKVKAGICIVKWCLDLWAAANHTNTPDSSGFVLCHVQLVAWVQHLHGSLVAAWACLHPACVDGTWGPCSSPTARAFHNRAWVNQFWMHLCWVNLDTDGGDEPSGVHWWNHGTVSIIAATVNSRISFHFQRTSFCIQGIMLQKQMVVPQCLGAEGNCATLGKIIKG